MRIVEIEERTPELVAELVCIWERSVRATHDFLSEADIERIRAYVPEAVAGIDRLTLAEGDDGVPIAFMGTQRSMLEMLFVDESARGQGIGSALVSHGIDAHGVREVNVNEQNPQAVGFYERMGFQTYRRTETDEQGDPFPLLYMRLPERYASVRYPGVLAVSMRKYV